MEHRKMDSERMVSGRVKDGVKEASQTGLGEAPGQPLLSLPSEAALHLLMMLTIFTL